MITDDMIAKWKRMPMIMRYDPRTDIYIGTKFLHLDGKDKLVKSAVITRSLVKLVEMNVGDRPKALRMVRTQLEYIINKRIDETSRD